VLSGAGAEVAGADSTESKADWAAGSTRDDAAGSRSLCRLFANRFRPERVGGSSGAASTGSDEMLIGSYKTRC
jgi:hypothetical protein